MLEIREITPTDAKQIKSFIELPFLLYRNVPQ
jgi:hypothetical protein